MNFGGEHCFCLHHQKFMAGCNARTQLSFPTTLALKRKRKLNAIFVQKVSNNSAHICGGFGLNERIREHKQSIFIKNQI